MLSQIHSTKELAEWFHVSFQPEFSPSSVAVMWGRANPNASLRPVFASTHYPEALLNKVLLKQNSVEFVPLLQAWQKTEGPVIKNLGNIPPGQQGSWLTPLKDASFNKVCALGCYDIRANYLTYLCITDPYGDMTDEETRGLLTVTVPVLHGVLGKIWRKNHRSKQKLLHELLTKREIEILKLVKNGKTNPEISTILGVTFPTIKNHLQNIMIKMRVNNRAEAVGKAFGHEPADTKFLEEAWPVVERGDSAHENARNK
ncbi:MAG TPA: helix-turn-helix transcriptional regulator [Thiobacillus sp.]